MAATLDKVVGEIRAIQKTARNGRKHDRAIWPMIILKTPKGWTGPKEVDGLKTEGFWRSHQVPLSELATKPDHIRLLEDWMKSYRPEELFDEDGALRPEIAALAPAGEQRMSANPHANGGCRRVRPAICPISPITRLKIGKPGERDAEATSVMGGFLRDVLHGQRGAAEFPRVRPRRDGFQPARARVSRHRPGMGCGDAAL